MSTEALLLSPEEILALTGYRQPAAQLAELRRQGFQRARRNPSRPAQFVADLSKNGQRLITNALAGWMVGREKF